MMGLRREFLNKTCCARGVDAGAAPRRTSGASIDYLSSQSWVMASCSHGAGGTTLTVLHDRGNMPEFRIFLFMTVSHFLEI